MVKHWEISHLSSKRNTTPLTRLVEILAWYITDECLFFFATEILSSLTLAFSSHVRDRYVRGADFRRITFFVTDNPHTCPGPRTVLWPTSPQWFAFDVASFFAVAFIHMIYPHLCKEYTVHRVHLQSSPYLKTAHVGPSDTSWNPRSN